MKAFFRQALTQATASSSEPRLLGTSKTVVFSAWPFVTCDTPFVMCDVPLVKGVEVDVLVGGGSGASCRVVVLGVAVVVVVAGAGAVASFSTAEARLNQIKLRNHQTDEDRP